MKVCIQGLGLISPQKTFETNGFLNEVVEYSDGFLKCIEPNYKEYLSPVLSRRMGKIIKMSLVAAKICLKDAEVENPDAIITGTGLGCIDDIEKFVSSMILNNEKQLYVTSFIQSTHNTVSSQIASYLNVNNYNITFVHRIFSFESTILNCMLLIQEDPKAKILIGAFDEITQLTFDIKQNSIYKKIPTSSLDLMKYDSKGAIAGEGAGFFLISADENKNAYANIELVSTIYESNLEIVEEKICTSLKEAGLDIEDIDTVMFGFNGDSEFDVIYKKMMVGLFKNKNHLYYKHLCGEFHSSSSFALGMCAQILKYQIVPEILQINTTTNLPPKRILIYNQLKGKNHSIIVLSK